MEVFIRDKDNNKFVICHNDIGKDKFICLPIEETIVSESLDQHDAEVRKQERQQVIAELREWAKQTKVNVGIDIIDYECFKQKLEEMKGE